MRKLAAVLFVGALVLGVMGCPPPGKVQGCKKCGTAPCACKGKKVKGCKKCGKAPCVCKAGAKGKGKEGG